MNSFSLKLVAVITMLIDHFGMVFMRQNEYYDWFRVVGRLAFPIFCFLLVEGYYHTKDIKQYLLRLGIFALISEIPFDLASSGRVWNSYSQNVYFTLVFGLAAVWAVDYARKHLDVIPAIISNLAAIFLTMFLALFLHTDYDAGGVLLILIFYLFRENKIILMIGVLAVLYFQFGSIEVYGAFAMIFILLYNGKKGRSMKYFFYAFYPVHLFLLYFIHQWIN